MNELLDLQPDHWNLIVLPREYRRNLLVAIAHFAEHGPLFVIDCGRWYDATVVIRAAHGRIEIVDRVQIRRAFICYEVAKLLQRTSASEAPVLILDILSSFYDENVQLRMRRFLLENSLLQFKRLSQITGLAVYVQPPPASADSLSLFERLENAASKVSTYVVPSPASDEQPGLF
jgi:hypothetical protein